MAQDEFQPDPNQSPAQTDQSRRPTQTEELSLQISQRQASATTSALKPEQRLARGRRPLFRN